MSTSYRGIHIQTVNANTMQMLEHGRPALVKTMDFGPNWTEWKDKYGIRCLVARVNCDNDSGLTPSPQAAAERLWPRVLEKIAPHAAVIDYVEAPWNEVHQGKDDWRELQALGVANRRFCELAAEYGFKVAVGNFSVGQPEVNLFRIFAEEAMPGAAALSCHEYWLNGIRGISWWQYRYIEFLKSIDPLLRRPVLITECGIDRGLEKPPQPRATAGWRSSGISADEYTRQLDEYWRGLGPEVIGIMVFNCGSLPGKNQWHDFEIGDVSPIQQWMAAGPHHDLSPDEPDEGEEMSDHNPLGRALAENGAFEQRLLTDPTLTDFIVISDEVRVPGTTGGDVVFLTAMNPGTLDKVLMVWSDGFDGAAVIPLT